MSIYVSDIEINNLLDYYGELGFASLPQWLQDELLTRRIRVRRREPTYYEILETFRDAREHRIMNNQLTIKDLQDKYLHRRSLTLIT